MSSRVLSLISACWVLLIAGACSSPSSPFEPERGWPAKTTGRPVLVGTLVDGDGHSLPRVSATFNHWSGIGVGDAQEVVTDHEGRFRIELPSSFAGASSEKRTIGLVGAAHRMAFYGARRAFPAGVYDIGEFLFADEADAGALRNLSDDALLSRLDLLQHWSSDAFDACLRECARRGGQRIVA